MYLRYLLCFVIFLCGCATYQSKLSPVFSYLQNGEPTKAADLLKEKANTPSNDQLAYLWDYSLVEQLAGNYKESNQGFQKSYDLAEWNDYHSISKIAASLLSTPELILFH